MIKKLLQSLQSPASRYSQKTAGDYLRTIDPQILAEFSDQQLEAVRTVLDQAIPKPSPKLVDLRFVIDLIFSRFYVVIFVGKDHRKKQRSYAVSWITKIGNVVTAIVLLIGLNLVITAFLFMGMYLIKSAIGIDLFPDHLFDRIPSLPS